LTGFPRARSIVLKDAICGTGLDGSEVERVTSDIIRLRPWGTPAD
jgi:hypothetical protein